MWTWLGGSSLVSMYGHWFDLTGSRYYMGNSWSNDEGPIREYRIVFGILLEARGSGVTKACQLQVLQSLGCVCLERGKSRHSLRAEYLKQGKSFTNRRISFGKMGFFPSYSSFRSILLIVLSIL